MSGSVGAPEEQSSGAGRQLTKLSVALRAPLGLRSLTPIAHCITPAAIAFANTSAATFICNSRDALVLLHAPT
jgi:hypothetical protein